MGAPRASLGWVKRKEKKHGHGALGMGSFISGKKEREEVSSAELQNPAFPWNFCSIPISIPIRDQPLTPTPTPSLPEDIPVVLLLFFWDLRCG